MQSLTVSAPAVAARWTTPNFSAPAVAARWTTPNSSQIERSSSGTVSLGLKM